MIHARPDYQERIQDSAGLIPADEPVFLLRAQDVMAPSLVDQWAAEAGLRGAASNIILAANNQASLMRQWQDAHGSKLPDLPPEPR